MRLLLILVTMFALIVPLPALADAHPGLHVNPHVPNVVLYAALGLAALAWISMAITLAVLRRRHRLAADRLVRARLNLAQARRTLHAAQDERAYWTGRLAFWRAMSQRHRN